MSNYPNLTGKTVLLTGAGGFFGRYFAKALAEAGVSLILVDRKEEALDEVRSSLEKGYSCEGKISTYVIDLYDRDHMRRRYEEIRAKRQIDVLVNNAFDFSVKTGFNIPEGRLECATFEQLQASFEAGIYWALVATQVFGFAMKTRGKGAIVNICSEYSFWVPSPKLYEGTDKFNPPGYCMAKHGLLGFTRYSASFLSPEVRVNALSPGAIPNTESQSHNAVTEKDPVLEKLLTKMLLGRLGHPTDLTGPLLFLCSDMSGYITGQNVIVDGGWSTASY
jgi:NAD(P)-dependent dehydrogenase (short-subunit alcohol dehydrogenase family)